MHHCDERTVVLREGLICTSKCVNICEVHVSPIFSESSVLHHIKLNDVLEFCDRIVGLPHKTYMYTHHSTTKTVYVFKFI